MNPFKPLEGVHATDQSRRVSVDDHMAFRDSIARPSSFDELDLSVDPLVEKFARPRKERQAARVLEILDQLERSCRE